VANDLSLAWGIASELAAQGAQLAFTYQGEILEKRVRPLAQSIGSQDIFPCEVSSDEEVACLFESLRQRWGQLDFIVHAIAFSDKNELKGKYVATTRENFRKTLDISRYSFTAIAQAAAPLMKSGGSLLTLTYHG